MVEPRQIAADAIGTDFVFLASADGETWWEFATVVDGAEEWFELVVADEEAKWLGRGNE
jgi:hypothetical protein